MKLPKDMLDLATHIVQSKPGHKQQPAITQTNLKLASPRLRQIKAGAEVVPGVSTFDTAGHTPGHIQRRIF
jgi:hypothetical protein